MHQKPEHILFAKMVTFCNYRERCTSEIEQKFKDLNAEEPHRTTVLQWLIEGDYFNDELYCNSFASGKFRIKRWGKMKIKAALNMKKLPGPMIEKALEQIDRSEYYNTARELILRNIESNDPDHIERQKTIRSLFIKGYSSSLVLDILSELKSVKEV